MAQSADELRLSLAALVAESQALRADVHTAEVARRRATQINMLFLGLLVLFVAMLAAIGLQGSRVINEVERTNAIMADCTTPGGQCYTESQVRTGRAIADIVRVSVYMSQCSRLYPDESGPEFDRKLEACVVERLRSDSDFLPVPGGRATPTPTPSARPGG